MGAKKTRLNQEAFDKVKLLQNAGVKTAMAVQITGLSSASVSRIFRFDTWNAYKTWRTEQTRKYHPEPKAKAPKSVEVPRQDSEEPKAIFYTASEQSAIELTRIANALERLADAWEAQPAKSGFFKK